MSSKGIHTANRLTVLVVVVSLLFLAIAVLSAWHFQRMQAHSEEVHSKNVASIRAAVELEMHIQELRHQLDRYLFLREFNGIDTSPLPSLTSLTSRRTRISRWLAQAQASAHSQEELAAIEQISKGLASFFAEIEKISETPGSQGDAARFVRRADGILENQVLAAARSYLSIDEALLEKSRTDAATQSHRLVLILISLGVFGSIIATIAGYGLARMISQSLFQLHIPMQDLAGKLSEVAGEVVVSGKLDLADLRPVIQRISAEVASVVEQLHARHQEILHADQLATVGQLAAGIAHEIRNPLMSMKMLVQSAREQHNGLDDVDLKILDEEIRRLEVLLNEFLDFARPKPLQKSIVDLRGLAEGVLAFLQPQADVRNVLLEFNSLALPVLLAVDAPRIRQVLLNLLLNGIQVTPPGGTVRLSLDTVEAAESKRFRIQIEDEGPGITPELSGRIFEPFFSTQETGLGMGLAVSQRIVKSHGGEISFASDGTGGAKFIVLLPLEQQASVSDAESSDAQQYDY